VLYRRLTGKEDPKRFLERLAITKQTRHKHKKIIWFHAASIGESLSILPIVDHLCQNKTIQILFTSGTTSSASILKEKLQSNVIHQYVPIENIFIINKFLKHWQPSLAIFVESEFWPLLIKSTKKYCKIISLNTSISEKSLKNWLRFHRIKNEVFNDVSFFIPKSSQDEQRLRSLKISNIQYFGNLKYCAEPLKYDIALLEQLQAQLSNRHLILFASIHTEEEHVLFAIYHQLKKITKEDFVFIVAPRHPHKLDSLLSSLKKQHINYRLHSATKSITDKTQFYIIDSFGQLGTFFRLSPITVMGGTFEKIGGHNIIEPSKLGSIVINGPYDYSIAEMSQEFTEKNALLKVSNAQECSLLLNSFFLNPLQYQQYSINALELIKEKQNILKKIIKTIEDEF
jgi:3-deoxy-D-manno-octulosonic-acid transferase